MAIENLNNRENDVVLFLNAVEAVLGTAPAQAAAISSLTDSTGGTADGTLSDGYTATVITAAVPTDAAAATATSIAAAVPAAAPAGGTGAAAGAWDTAANRDLAITTINDLRTHAIELDLDYEALLVDVADIRTKYAVSTTHSAELDLDYEALRLDVGVNNDNVAELNAKVDLILAALRAHGLIAT